MSTRLLVAQIVALAVVCGAALGGAPAGAEPAFGRATAGAEPAVGRATAGAEPASSGGVTASAVKRAKAARCFKRRRAARRARLRRDPTRRQPRRCGSGRAQHVVGRKVGGATGALAPAAGSAVPGSPAPARSPASGGAETTAPAPETTPPAAPVISTLGVTAYDMNGFVLRLTKTSVPAGRLTIFFRNGDVSDHNLWLSSPGGETVERISDTVGENGGASRTVPVTAGAWRLFCALPDHDAMTRTLTVTP